MRRWFHGSMVFLAGAAAGGQYVAHHVLLALLIAFALGAFAALAAITTSRLVHRALHRTARGPRAAAPDGDGWHACANPQCCAPIPNTTRRRYCGEPCKRYARLRREAAAIDDGAIPF